MTRLHQVQVHPAVAIVVEHAAAGAHDFRQVFPLAGAVDVHELESGSSGNIAKIHGRFGCGQVRRLFARTGSDHDYGREPPEDYSLV